MLVAARAHADAPDDSDAYGDVADARTVDGGDASDTLRDHGNDDLDVLIGLRTRDPRGPRRRVASTDEPDSTLSRPSASYVAVACDDSEPDCTVRIAAAPALSAVITAALHAAGVADNPVPSWRRRSRWSALVPAISARVGNSQSWREITDPTVSRAASYDVRASWRLDRLIYDPNEPRFAAFDISRRRERRHITALTNRAYVTWVQAQAANALIEAEAAHAELDALTDGWFSETLARRERDRHLADRPTFGRLPQ